MITQISIQTNRKIKKIKKNKQNKQNRNKGDDSEDDTKVVKKMPMLIKHINMFNHENKTKD